MRVGPALTLALSLTQVFNLLEFRDFNRWLLPLKGEQLQPPAGYVGAVLQDTKLAEIADAEERRWLHRGAFDTITVWKHDEEPQEDDPIFKCMRYAGIADVLHADHSDEPEDEPTEAS